MHLVLIETSGNQNYIFSTNKLKENIGASELTYLAGTKWVLEAVEIVSHSGTWSLFKNDDQLRDKLLDTNLNKPIDLSNDVKVEVIVATSGKALLITQDDKIAKNIIHYVTKKALCEAPQLDICGVISEPFNWSKNSLGDFNRQVHQKFQSVRSQKPSPDLRFLRLPVVDECSTSGLPASPQVDRISQKHISYVSAAKQESSQQALERISFLLENDQRQRSFVKTIRKLNTLFEEELDWLAVVHADGNGLGEIFLNFEKIIEDSELNTSQANRDYVNKLRKFSIALDICTEKAFISALKAFAPNKEGLIPVVPLILGGDDLTVVCDGKPALQFTHLFLKAFEEETASIEHCDGIIPKIAEKAKALGVGRLSACAGVAIIKPHFPFSVAYELSEKLMKSAKQVKNKVIRENTNKPYPCSALDFHVLYDSSDVELNKIRGKLQIEKGKEKIKLYQRPYVVTSPEQLQGALGTEWVNFHRWEILEEQVRVLTDTEDGRRKLPNSQMHDLRAGLFFGKDVADARFRLIRDRYRDAEIMKLAGSEDSLFQQEPKSEFYVTRLLDAIDAAEFLDKQGEAHE